MWDCAKGQISVRKLNFAAAAMDHGMCACRFRRDSHPSIIVTATIDPEFFETDNRLAAAMACAPADFDVIIVGASGFTGKFVLREFLHCMSQACSRTHVEGAWPPFSLALAGRNVAKLKETLAWAIATAPQSALPECELRKIEFIEADALDAAAMDEVCSRARVLVNCVGPCLLYGETIVGACVKAGVHYLDISGEAEFMEKMELQYGQRALEKRCLVVSACASVSAMSDLGLLFHLRQWPPQAVPSSVDAYACFYSFTCNNAASAETGFISLGNVDRLARFRRSAPKKPNLKLTEREADRTSVTADMRA